MKRGSRRFLRKIAKGEVGEIIENYLEGGITKNEGEKDIDLMKELERLLLQKERRRLIEFSAEIRESVFFINKLVNGVAAGKEMEKELLMDLRKRVAMKCGIVFDLYVRSYGGIVKSLYELYLSGIFRGEFRRGVAKALSVEERRVKDLEFGFMYLDGLLREYGIRLSEVKGREVAGGLKGIKVEIEKSKFEKSESRESRSGKNLEKGFRFKKFLLRALEESGARIEMVEKTGAKVEAEERTKIRKAGIKEARKEQIGAEKGGEVENRVGNNKDRKEGREERREKRKKRKWGLRLNR